MAEARMAVEPHTLGLRTGFEVDTSIKEIQAHVSAAGFVLYIPHPRFLIRNLMRRLMHGYSAISLAFLPVPLPAVITIVAATAAIVARSPSSSWLRSGALADHVWKLDSMLPFTNRLSTKLRVTYLAISTSTIILGGFTYSQRLFLRQLLSYHGWLYERSTKSLKTKIWGMMLKNMFTLRFYHATLSFDGALPTLPLPTISETVPRYLETVKPLLPADEYLTMVEHANSFLKKEGPTLQWYLRLKWLLSPNYISDWWLKYVYLRGRESICINSNWYGIMYGDYFPTNSQIARAAVCTYNLVRAKLLLDNGTLEPQLLGGTVPLCMQQYKYIFSTTRVPGREVDSLVTYDSTESSYVVVLSKGRFYKLPVFSPKSTKQLSPLQLQSAYRGILDSTEVADPHEALLPALTSANRTTWASVREQYFLRHPKNRQALEIVERAMFVVCLDDETGPTTYSDEGRRYLMGNGHNRWSDKSFCFVVLENAKAGVHAEHSWGDAPTLAHIVEWISCSDEKREFYDRDGNVAPTKADEEKLSSGKWTAYEAEQFRFSTKDPQLQQHIEDAHAHYLKEIKDLDLAIGRYDKYGKGKCKAGKCSPDAWLQMSLQLAYFRDRGRFDQTYESSMVRLFKAGRTETIRTVSNESCAWVRAMEDPAASNATRLELLATAAERHQKYSHDAMTGKGVDRHLFALYVVSIGKSIDSPFLQAALKSKWKLSTSQVPTRQMDKKHHHPDESKFHTPNGGFGPVADDGYGISYSIFGEGIFYFNISSKVAFSGTDSARMLNNVFRALDDMGSLVTETKKVK